MAKKIKSQDVYTPRWIAIQQREADENANEKTQSTKTENGDRYDGRGDRELK